MELWLGLGVGVLLGAGALWLVLRRNLEHETSVQVAQLPVDMAALVDALPEIGVVLAPDNSVLHASAGAVGLGLVRAGAVMAPTVMEYVDRARATNSVQDESVDLRRPAPGRGFVALSLRVAPMPRGLVLVTARDLSTVSRVESVRRDFVANVSHELKTPVGALTLLAEAVEQSADDPESVRHFAGRMQHESARLGSLVRDLIDLSRLQSDDPLSHATELDVDSLVEQAIEAVRTSAEARNITVVDSGTPDLVVEGDESQLVTAVRNLLANAVAYSPEHTQVTVTTLLSDDGIEIAVRDQGVGIPESEQTRIFERFYRIDPARSRVTGGTGLGLAIVKHVCVNHGGRVSVWSVPGEGSTFTLKLPATQPLLHSQTLDDIRQDAVVVPLREGVS